MDYKAWQNEFDVTKWFDSIVAGEDRCGSYDFCVKCDKEVSEPCAHAADRFKKKYVRIATVCVRFRT